MKANADKCYHLTSSNKESSPCIDNNIVKNSKYEKIFGVKSDQKLNFNAHINDIRKKVHCLELHNSWIFQRGVFYKMSFSCLSSVTALQFACTTGTLKIKKKLPS